MKRVLFILFSFIATFTFSQVTGEFIGQIHAEDEDFGTVLTFTIIQGNKDTALCFGDPYQLGPDHTGMIRIRDLEAFKRYKSYVLVINVLDNGIPGAPWPQLSARARVRIRYPNKFTVEPL